MAQDGVILISDDEDEDTSRVNDSVFIVDDCNEKGTTAIVETNEVVDEDLSVTFSKKATVLPHARYDCGSSPFSPTENDTTSPVAQNNTFCEQCFCYICDKLASECEIWKTPGICHCNAHKRSEYWKEQRNKAILGYLHVFNFELMEVDADLRLAESHLLTFESCLTDKYNTFLRGFRMPLSTVVACACYCHTANPNATACKRCKSRHVDVLLYNYSEVFQYVSGFLDKAEREHSKTAAVMLLGAAKLFVSHTQPPGVSHLNDPKANVTDAVPLLLMRVTNTLKSLMVSPDFSNTFLNKLQVFFRSFPLPIKCSWMVNSLNVHPWDSPLLVAVLKGQNVTGERCVKGRKEFLFEPLAVVEARVKRLKEQCKYRELTRYLKVVKSDDRIRLQTLKDYIPLYTCQSGDLGSAISSFFSAGFHTCCSACRVSPAQFSVYLRILATGMAPVGADLFKSTQWEAIAGAKIPKKSDVIRWGLRILHCNTGLFLSSGCWIDFIKVACSDPSCHAATLTPASFKAPDPAFLAVTRESAKVLLLEKNSGDSLFLITNKFLHPYPEQALLLLVTQALIHRLLHCRLAPVLGVVMAFRENVWALRWFYNGLSTNSSVTQIFLSTLLDELYGSASSLPSRLEPSDFGFIAEFLALCIQDPHPALYPVKLFLLNDLLKHWNEHIIPWQHHLRLSLLRGSDLSPDTQTFLDMMQRRTF